MTGTTTKSGVAGETRSTRHNIASPNTAREAELFVSDASVARASMTITASSMVRSLNKACVNASMGIIKAASFVVLAASSCFPSPSCGLRGLALHDCTRMRPDREEDPVVSLLFTPS